MGNIVEFKNVNKKFGKSTIIKNASFCIKRNAICGFIGPNGAGKTTIIKLLLGIIPKTDGEIKIMIDDNKTNQTDSLSSIGTIVSGPAYYGNLNAYQNIKIVANMKNIDLTDKQIEDYLELVGLDNIANKKVSHFSMGMKQRLAIACSLIGDPQFLIWDEPINGLDPTGIIEIRNLMTKLHQTRNVTFLISSHILSELDKIVDKIILINKGSIVYNGTAEELLEKYQCATLEEAYMNCMQNVEG
ncbi:ABC-2 type transport system ATP-binding protein [Granulicatella balaenopterae]|uniref:ABC-2 type transport system ATP-binding protein n=1 Tax=Granulicatella balaenopterae TaxID=137733 RepID=A0A1H9JQT1_9LACT|nr:ABC transporter ATP-binding protein [Granulicatella balaenopterae]SEQ89192.1 ABC-2 type transport system ATP-binding protein [Granulicatella balaenopterae]